MPELPEVETTVRGIRPHLENHTIRSIQVYQPRLRWPVPEEIHTLQQKKILAVARRGKYILLHTRQAVVIMHLGMSGSLRLCTKKEALRKHDHVELTLSNRYSLRLHDPRRFGCVLITFEDVTQHPLLQTLGPEPLSDAFHGQHLYTAAKGRKTAIKNLIMDSHIVVGVGNIYASEALYLSGIRPGRSCARVTKRQYDALAENIKRVLRHAIDMGGTTLRDFVNSSGNPGYFKQQLNVYGRAGEPCSECTSIIKSRVIGQRSSFYCPQCQL